MPRTVRDSNLESRTARSRLKAAHKPYFRLIEPGLHLGYRKLASGPGTWIVRRYAGAGAYTAENLRSPEGELVVADDYADADGMIVLSFAQAQTAARVARHGRRNERYTVANAITDYLDAKAADGRTMRETHSRARAHILPALGDKEAAALTTEAIRDWHRGLANAAPRLRTRPGEAQRFGDQGEKRRRQASANRVFTILRAALNHAFAEGKIASDTAWRKVKRFGGVEVARLRYLTVAEARRLVNACDPEFRPLVQAALQTGGRYGQLTALTVADFNPDPGTVHMRTLKGGGHEREYHVTLTEEGADFFREVCAGRSGHELMFQRNGREWRREEQARPMRVACERAKITPPIGFHGLRHTWASLSVMNALPLMVVARNLGHVDTGMVEKHYGHLAPSYVAEAIRKSAPKFGFKPSGVSPLRRA